MIGLITLPLDFDEILNNVTIVLTNVGVFAKIVNCLIQRKKVRKTLKYKFSKRNTKIHGKTLIYF